jgi:hypothetical protein
MRNLLVLAFVCVLFSCQTTDTVTVDPTTPAVTEVTPAVAPAPAEVAPVPPTFSTCEIIVNKKPVTKVIKNVAGEKGTCVVLQDNVIIYNAKHDLKYCAAMFAKHVAHMTHKGYTCK